MGFLKITRAVPVEKVRKNVFFKNPFSLTPEQNIVYYEISKLANPPKNILGNNAPQDLAHVIWPIKISALQCA